MTIVELELEDVRVLRRREEAGGGGRPEETDKRLMRDA